MGSLLLALPVLAIVLAALDSAFVRWAHPWQPADVRLFFHAYDVWACVGLVALLPAWLTLRRWDRRAGRARHSWRADARPWVVLLGWMALPVIAHATLDRYTGLVGFQGLVAPRPWLELATVLALASGVIVTLDRWHGALHGPRTASIGVAAALALGLLLPSAPEAPLAADAAPRPNLLLMVWDTCRSDRLEPYGFPRPTSPGLERLAQQSLVFEDSLSVSTFTFTSHLSLLTGVHPETHGAELSTMRFDPARAASIAELLRAQGYRTGAFVGTSVLAGSTGLRAGFDSYDDAVDPPVCDTFAWALVHDLQTIASDLVPALRFDGRPHWIQDFQRPGGEVLDRALAWIRRPSPRPWFCFVNLYDVHWPYLPEGEGRERLVEPYDGPVDGFLFRSDHWRAGYEMTPADKSHVSELYEGEIRELDQRVEGFLDRLELGHGGTAVLMTADHGEGLGEDEVWNHDDVREPQVRVPLLLRLPEPNPTGRRVHEPVSGVDVAPTLLGLAGVEAPRGCEGHDLLSGVLPAERERWVDDRDHVGTDHFHCVLYRGAFKLVRFGVEPSVRYELYDLAQDPSATRDVQTEHPELFAELVQRMRERSGRSTRAETASADSAAALKALGYGGD